MKKCLVVYNPNSGKYNKEVTLPKIEKILNEYDYSVIIEKTKYKGDATSIVANIDKCDLVVFINPKKLADAKTESDYRMLGSDAKVVEGLETNAKKQEGILEKRKSDYDLAAEQYGNYSNTINNYENAQSAVLRGNYKKATDILSKKGISYFEYSKDVDEATKQAVDALYQEAIEAGIQAKRTKENI